jgi:hypothetical protein
MNTSTSGATVLTLALACFPVAASAQLTYVSQSRTVIAQASTVSAPDFAPFNQTLSRTVELFPSTGWFVTGVSSQNSTLGSSQIRLNARNDTSGAFFTGGGQVTGGFARFTFDVTFDLSINSQVSLIGLNTALSSPLIPSASQQTIRLTRIGTPAPIFERVFNPENVAATSGPFTFITNLSAGRYRIEADALTSSSGGTQVGSINPNTGLINFAFTVPAPGAVAPALIAGAVLTLRRRRN